MQNNNSTSDMVTTAKGLQEASLSYAVVVIPEPPLRAQIITTSVAIARSSQSRYVIDDEMYPPHLSLYMGGTDPKFVEDLLEGLYVAVQPHVSATLVADKLYHEPGGFIAVSCIQNHSLLSLASSVIDVCGRFHQKQPRYRPRVLARWPQLPPAHKELVKAYGTDKVPPLWQPHFSVADVEEEHTFAALRIAEMHLSLPQLFSIAAIELVDIGPNNERWHALERWPAK